MNERNEELLAGLRVVKQMIHDVSNLNEQRRKIQAGYVDPRPHYRKMWHGIKPFWIKFPIVMVFALILGGIMFKPMYLYYAQGVVTKTFLEQSVFLRFLIPFVVLVSVTVMTLYQLIHNSVVKAHNRREGEHSEAVKEHNRALGQQEGRILERLSAIQKQYYEQVMSWYPESYGYPDAVDFFVKVVESQQAHTMGEAAALFEQDVRYRQEMKHREDQLAEMRRHNYEKERSDKIGNYINAAVGIGQIGAMNNIANAHNNSANAQNRIANKMDRYYW